MKELLEMNLREITHHCSDLKRQRNRAYGRGDTDQEERLNALLKEAASVLAVKITIEKAALSHKLDRLIDMEIVVEWLKGYQAHERDTIETLFARAEAAGDVLYSYEEVKRLLGRVKVSPSGIPAAEPSAHSGIRVGGSAPG